MRGAGGAGGGLHEVIAVCASLTVGVIVCTCAVTQFKDLYVCAEALKSFVLSCRIECTSSGFLMQLLSLIFES